MSWITNSFFDIFKIGPGPSSSHTIGPMLAAGRFRKKLDALCSEENVPVEIHLYGSLALTGKGHGSDRAALAGLLGEVPETCDTVRLAGLLSDRNSLCRIPLSRGSALCSADGIVFHRGENPYPSPNAIRFAAGGIEGVYYSIGGGFLREPGEEGEAEDPPGLPYRYNSIDSFQKVLDRTGKSPVEVLFANESAVTGMEEREVRSRLRRVIGAMTGAVERGLAAEGVLPGILGVESRAKALFRAAESSASEEEGGVGRDLLRLDSFALAAAEENARGNLVVTAPTSGSSGILPSLIHFLLAYRKVPAERVEESLAVAALFAFVARRNASISGAEVGCQGEIGVASAMGAALLAQVSGAEFSAVAASAEIALEHHLGMSCDPVAGYVQVPCIERNAVGTVTAFNAFLLASAAPHKGKVTFDEVLAAMYETGLKMNPAFRETSLGGLARATCCM